MQFYYFYISNLIVLLQSIIDVVVKLHYNLNQRGALNWYPDFIYINNIKFEH